MSDIGAIYAGLSPDVALQFLQSPPTTTDRSLKDVSRLPAREDNFINLDFAAEVTALRAAMGNAQEASALLQVIKKAYDRIAVLLSEMSGYADSAADSSVSSRDRAVLNEKFDAARDEVDAIANATTFRRANVITADKTFDFQVGAGGSSGSTVSVDVISALAADLTAGLDTASLTSLANATAAQTTVTNARSALDDALAAVKATLTRLSTVSRNNAIAETANDELAKARMISVQVSDEILIKGKFFIQSQLKLLFTNLFRAPARFFDISA